MRAPANPRFNSSVALLILLAFGAGAFLERYGLLPSGTSTAPPAVRATFAPFWEAWDLVEKYYVDRPAVQPQHMTAGAIRGMLASLGDEGHTSYLSAAEFEEMKNGLAGKLDGIGARMTLRNKQPTVVGTVPDSPARAAGLRAGDILLEVNGKAVAALPLERIVLMVRGPAGTTVRLRVLHTEIRTNQELPLVGATVLGCAASLHDDGLLLALAALFPKTSEIQELEITRAKVDVPALAWCMVPGQPLVHVALREFGANADSQLRSALRDARAQGARGLLLDVRLNPGGLKQQAVAVTSEFLKEGNVFLEEDAQGKREAVPVQPGGTALDLPLVVLIDEGTASSAEIFAGAIQDHERGKLVGTKTFGTGTVLLPFTLRDGSAVLLAVEQWLTPNGRVIWHKGIAPDVAVKLPPGARLLFPEDEARLSPTELSHSEDAQFLKGLELLTQQLKSPAKK
jgi:carboxyl-terminal processing protease